MKIRKLMLLAVLLSVLSSGFGQSVSYQQNLQACLNGWATCNHAMLTTEEAGRVATAAPAAGLSASPTAVPGTAENGSYYGEPNKNGIPKTVHVHGYYRRDGTYVRGYYRSAPGTNPPRIHIR